MVPEILFPKIAIERCEATLTTWWCFTFAETNPYKSSRTGDISRRGHLKKGTYQNGFHILRQKMSVKTGGGRA